MRRALKLLILALDPGREKLGYAIFRNGKVERKGILSISQFDSLKEECQKAGKIILGKGTGWKFLYQILKEQGLEGKIVLIEERGSTEEAKRRFFRDTPGKGIVWFIRKWLNLPERPVDDISAQIIGENFLKNSPSPIPKNCNSSSRQNPSID